MRAVIQRVSEARVSVDGEVVGQIGPGLLVLLGVHRADTSFDADWVARKCAALRIFPDDAGRMNRSIAETGVSALVISQFTLYGDARKGNRPSFVSSATPDEAEPRYEEFLVALERELGQRPERGVFGATMDVHLVNNGPVTIIIEHGGAD